MSYDKHRRLCTAPQGTNVTGAVRPIGGSAAARQEWGIVIDQESAADTGLGAQLDGAGLALNARRAEKLLSEAGLAIGLSDRTTMVGERSVRTRP